MSAATLLVLAWMATIASALVARRPAPAAARLTPPPVSPRRRVQRPARRRRADAAERRAVADAVPDVVDLFAVAIASGLNPRLALAAVAERAPPSPLAAALVDVETRVSTTGARLADALERLPDDVGSDAVRPFVAAITDAERYGTPIGPTLDRLADEARRTRQRRAEEAARRIPVKLLFPLVLCILPAFGLLTVAPLIAGGLRALRL
jgi:tight adherence protein C